MRNATVKMKILVKIKKKTEEVRKMNIKIGDFVKGTENDYGVTNEKMTKAVVTKILSDTMIYIHILEHTEDKTGGFEVEASKFEVIGHQKEFNREDVLEFLRSGCKKAILEYNLSGADLRGADLRGADLSEANLDFSC
jgi:hypothetical protein